MRTRYQAVLLAAALSAVPMSACTTVSSAPAAAHPASDVATDDQAVRAAVMKLLRGYETNDVDGVIALLDPVRFTILGSDVSEVVDTHDELRALMAADFAMWGSARFTDVRDFDLRSDGTLATANFLMSFSAGGGAPVPVRLTTTWRRVNGEWKLTQSTSSVPTQRG